MWVQDLDEVCDFLKGSFPYYLLFFVPFLIIISPVGAAHEFPVYRMHQYDLHGVAHGCRSAGINLEARSVRSWKTSRHCVVTRMKDLSPERFREIRSKAGALLVVLPKDMANPSQDLLDLEMEMMADPVPIPVYFAKWSKDLESIADEVAAQPTDQGGTAMDAMTSAVTANGYQMVVSSAAPVPRDAAVASVQGTLLGRGVPETLPTIAIVAHMDALGVAPELSFGGDSNASGVAILLEIARIFSALYGNARTHPRFNILFLVSGAGKLNYLGSKKYLEDQIDSLEGSLLQYAAFVVCLESLGRNSSSLNLHVSKPPKESSLGGALLVAAQTVSDSTEMVHKKINLADEVLAWEHERFSIRRLPAFTFSAIKNHKDPWRNTIFDTAETVDIGALEQNAATIVESLARVIYNISEDGLVDGQLKVEPDALKSSLKLIAGTPRSASLLAAPSDRPAPLVVTIRDLLSRHISDVRTTALLPDRRDPDLVLYDATASVLHVYSVKAAVFDLLLTVVIVAYLGAVFLALNYFPEFYSALSKLVSGKKKIS